MTKAAEKVMRFTHVSLENWKNFKQVDVDLQRRAFLVGPNASGKSNFLDVFRFLRDIVSVGGGLQRAVQDRHGVSSLRCLASRQYSDILIDVRMKAESGGPQWQYRLKFGQDNRQRPFIKEEKVVKNGKVILARPNRKDHDDPERCTQTYLEQVYANQRFREVAEFFGRVRYLHIVPQLVREPDRSVGKQNDPYGGDFLEQVASAAKNTQRASRRPMLEALQAAVPHLKTLELKRDDRGTPHLFMKCEHWRSQGAWQREDQFSDGTLRLIGLLWAVWDGSGPLLLEEPEISLHPEFVRFIPQVFARLQRRTGRQILVSTHSYDLLRDEGIGLDEVLLLLPSREGSEVRTAGFFADIRALLEGGVSLAEAVLPRTAPSKLEQLLLAFGDDR